MTEDDAALLRKKLARVTNAVHSVGKNASADMGDKIGAVAYANIGAVLTAIKSELQAEGLSLMQPFGFVTVDGGLPVMTIDTIITDTATGHFLVFQGPGFPVKGDPQAAGGAITYFRRYSLVTLFGLVVEDDDASQATHIERNPNRRTPAEGEIRDWLSTITVEDTKLFAADFKDEFGTTLSNLPTGRHGDALTFMKFWKTGSGPTAEEPPTTTDTQGD